VIIDRRTSIRALFGGLAAALPCLARSQPADRVVRVGILRPTAAPSSPTDQMAAGIPMALRELGYVEGRNLIVEQRWAGGDLERLPALARELLQARVDVIVAVGAQATRAVSQASATVPVVMYGNLDPVALGLVSSLARPGGNVTGTTTLAPQMMVKGLELLKETMPSLVRVLVLTYPADPISRGQIVALQSAAKSLGIELFVQDIASPADFATAFETGRKAGVQAVVTTVESIFSANRDLLIGLVRSHKLPSLFAHNYLVRAGGLMSYDADRDVLTGRTANFVDKLLKGAKPGDLPIEQPAVFTISVNTGTARALGITIPPAILARATELIE